MNTDSSKFCYRFSIISLLVSLLGWLPHWGKYPNPMFLQWLSIFIRKTWIISSFWLIDTLSLYWLTCKLEHEFMHVHLSLFHAYKLICNSPLFTGERLCNGRPYVFYPNSCFIFLAYKGEVVCEYSDKDLNIFCFYKQDTASFGNQYAQFGFDGIEKLKLTWLSIGQHWFFLWVENTAVTSWLFQSTNVHVQWTTIESTSVHWWTPGSPSWNKLRSMGNMHQNAFHKVPQISSVQYFPPPKCKFALCTANLQNLWSSCVGSRTQTL